MSDGGWYGYPPQEPDPYGQPQDDWDRPPLDYGNSAQNPGYDQYGQAADPQAYYGQQPQQPQQPRHPRQRQPPGRPQHRDPQAPSQNPYLQPGQGYDGGPYPAQQYPTGQQPAVDYEDYRQPGYDGAYGAGGGTGRPAGQGYEQPGYDRPGGYDQAAYGSGPYDAASRGGAGRPAAGAGTGSRRRAAPAGGPGDGYAEQPPRDPYQDLAEPAGGADEYEYPGAARGTRGAGPRPRAGDRGTGPQPRVGDYSTGPQPRVGDYGTGTGTQPRIEDEDRFPLPGRDDEARGFDDEDDEDGGRRGRGGKTAKNSRRSCTMIFVLFAILAGLLGYGGYQGYKYYESHYGPPADYSSSTGTAQTVVVTIPDSATGNQIGQILFTKGVIKSERAFTQACNGNSQCASVQANTYQLHEQLSAAAALKALLDPGNVYNKAQLLVRPGEQATTVFTDLEQKTGWTQAQIVSAIGGGQIDLPDYAKAKPGTKFPFANIEGMLFTGTYQLPDYTTPTQLLKTMVDKQLAMFQAVGLTQKASSLNMTPYQVLTVASMARAEAGGDPSDLSKIAGVIYTRLKQSQYSKLGFDTSTLYGLGRTSPQPTRSELQDSGNPYNLRVIAGLPPGPIDSVDQTALTSALAPTDSTDVYFCAVNGTVHYASNNTAWAALGKQFPGDCG